MSNISKHLELLGMRVKDRVTAAEGVVTSVCFDLYGCIQAALNPGLDKEGKPQDSHWFDVARFEVTSKKPVMDRPTFEMTPQIIADAGKGPSEKPSFHKP